MGCESILPAQFRTLVLAPLSSCRLTATTDPGGSGVSP